MDLSFNKNEDHNKLLLSQLKQNFRKYDWAVVKNGFKNFNEGKMTARESIT
jgi:hypothetical protein